MSKDQYIKETMADHKKQVDSLRACYAVWADMADQMKFFSGSSVTTVHARMLMRRVKKNLSDTLVCDGKFM